MKSDTPQHPPPIELSIVMPSLDEAETIATCIEKAAAFLARHGIRGEIVVADNGSTDRTREIAAECGARVVEVKRKGYGNALAGGIAAARGKYVIMGDSDESYDFSDLLPFVAKLRCGYDLVMGNRFKGGIRRGAMPALHRYLGNPLLTIIGRIFFGSPCGDFHCGLRGFSREAVRRMDLQTGGMEFASEMVIKATLLGMRVTEVPTTLSPDGRSRPPHLRRWRDGWRHLRFMLLYSPEWLFFYPGSALMVAGAAVGTRLFFGPIVIGSVTFDVQTMLFAATLFIVGYQSCLFAMFARFFATTEGLLPRDSRLARLPSKIPLELGVFCGVLLALAGVGGTIYSLRLWATSSFGGLDPQVTLRFVVPSVTSIIVGLQTVLGSFFFSVLELQRRSTPAPNHHP